MPLAMARPWKHPQTGIYWLRKRMPERLRIIVGKTEEKFSLKTRDPDEAKRLQAEALVAIEGRWRSLQAPIRKLDKSELDRISVQAYQRCLEMNGTPSLKWDTELAKELWTVFVFPTGLDIVTYVVSPEWMRQPSLNSHRRVAP